MHVSHFAALASFALMLSACGGGDQPETTQEPAATQAPATPAQAPAEGAAGAAAPAPVTGTVHEVRMVGDAQGYRFEPANLTIRAGDGVRFINVNGFPHDISFAGEEIPAAGRAQLIANMPNTRSELTSQLFLQPNETYTISFANAAPGRYPFHCTPHLAMGMRGEITVQ